MTGCTYIIGAGIAAAIGYCIWRMYLNKRNFLASVQEDAVEGTLRMDDIINYFKSQQIIKGQDIPFLADGDCEEFRRMLHAPYPKKKEGYQTFFIGVYNEKKDEIKFARLIHAREVEQKVKEVLGSEHLVVLG